MSLYRTGLRLALFLSLGVAMPVGSGNRFHRCEPRFHFALSDKGDQSIEPASVSPPQSGLHT